eukprot:scaffold84678_cov64-Phaeocystis_antarctica.AAC.7
MPVGRDQPGPARAVVSLNLGPDLLDQPGKAAEVGGVLPRAQVRLDAARVDAPFAPMFTDELIAKGEPPWHVARPPGVAQQLCRIGRVPLAAPARAARVVGGVMQAVGPRGASNLRPSIPCRGTTGGARPIAARPGSPRQPGSLGASRASAHQNPRCSPPGPPRLCQTPHSAQSPRASLPGGGSSGRAHAARREGGCRRGRW